MAIIFLNKYPIVVAVLILVCIGIAIWKLLQQRSINELNDKKNIVSLAERRVTAAEAQEKEVNNRIYEKQRKIQELQADYNSLDEKFSESKRQKEVELQSQLSSLYEQIEKAKGDSILKKYIKMKTLYESYQSANKGYIKSGETQLDESFLNSLDPTVEIQLNCMNVKQLRSLYNQNKKLIQDCLNLKISAFK